MALDVGRNGVAGQLPGSGPAASLRCGLLLPFPALVRGSKGPARARARVLLPYFALLTGY